MANKKSDCVISLEAVQELSEALDSTSQDLFGFDADMLLSLVDAFENPAQLNQVLAKSRWAIAEGVFFEVNVNNMIAAVATHKLNLMGNATAFGWQFLKQGLTTTSANLTSGPTSLRARTENMILVDQIQDVIRTTKDMWFAAFPASSKYIPEGIRQRSRMVPDPDFPDQKLDSGTISDPSVSVRTSTPTLGIPEPQGYKNLGWGNLHDLPLDLFSHPDFVAGTKAAKRAHSVAEPVSIRQQFVDAITTKEGADAAQTRADKAAKIHQEARERERTITGKHAAEFFRVGKHGIAPDGAIGKTVDVVGGVVNMPGEAMRHEDLMAKAFNYRIELTKQARLQAEKMARTAADQDALFEIFRKHPTDQMVIDAADLANENTFTAELGRVAGAARVFLQLPVLRMFTPFYRTLVNLNKKGIKESAIGEAARIFTPYKGGDYYKRLAQRTPEGDAARAQLAASSLMTWAIIDMLDGNVLEDGFGFTGHLDMRDEQQRLRAETVAPPFSYLDKNGKLWNFQDLEPVRSILAFYMGGKEMLQKVEELEVLDPETGRFFDQSQVIHDLLVTPLEHLYGDYFAMESLQKIVMLFESLVSDDPESTARADQLLADLAVTFAGGPAYLRDVKSAGSLIEDALGVEQSKKFFDNELRLANDIREKLDNRWFGSEHGVPYTLWGERKKARRGLTLWAQSSLFTSERKPDAVDFEFHKLKIPFMDNPREVNVPDTGARVKLTTQQREEFMVLGGQGGFIPELGKNLPPMKEFVKGVMFMPGMRTKPKHVREKIITEAVRLRQNAIAGLMTARYKDLQDQVIEQNTLKAQLATGQLAPTIQFDTRYLEALFKGTPLIQLLEEPQLAPSRIRALPTQ